MNVLSVMPSTQPTVLFRQNGSFWSSDPQIYHGGKNRYYLEVCHSKRSVLLIPWHHPRSTSLTSQSCQYADQSGTLLHFAQLSRGYFPKSAGSCFISLFSHSLTRVETVLLYGLATLPCTYWRSHAQMSHPLAIKSCWCCRHEEETEWMVRDRQENSLGNNDWWSSIIFSEVNFRLGSVNCILVTPCLNLLVCY